MGKGTTDMELRLYGKILWRRIWVIVLVIGIVGIYVGYQYYVVREAPEENLTYHSEVDVRIGLQNLPSNNNLTFTDYITTSETLADEFTTSPALTSTTFGQQIIQQIRNDMPTITTHYPHADLGDWTNPLTVTKALSATHTHSVVTIQVNWSTEAGAWAIARAAGEVCHNHIADYMSYKVDNQTTVNANYPIPAANVINKERKTNTVSTISTTKTSQLLALLIVGLITGIALAFLIEHLDDRIYESSEIEQLLQLPIYGEIPRIPTPGRK